MLWLLRLYWPYKKYGVFYLPLKVEIFKINFIFDALHVQFNFWLEQSKECFRRPLSRLDVLRMWILYRTAWRCVTAIKTREKQKE
jgi:hypothetical protein